MDASDIAELAKENEVYVDATEKKPCEYDVPLGTGRHGQLQALSASRFSEVHSNSFQESGFGKRTMTQELQSIIHINYQMYRQMNVISCSSPPPLDPVC